MPQIHVVTQLELCLHNLDSGINVGHGINIGHGINVGHAKCGENKRRALNNCGVAEF